MDEGDEIKNLFLKKISIIKIKKRQIIPQFIFQGQLLILKRKILIFVIYLKK